MEPIIKDMKPIKENRSIKEVKASSRVTPRLMDGLQKASQEKGVEHAYWVAVSNTFKGEQPSDKDNTDGYIDIKFTDTELFMLMEFKDDKNLDKRSNCIRVLVQLLFYMHNIREEQARIPNMVMAGDRRHAFVMNSKSLVRYLEYPNIDWSTRPSKAAKKYAKTLVVDMDNDSSIEFYVHNLDDNFDFNDLVKDIALLVSDTQEKIKLTPSNINVAFDQFINNVVLNKKKFTAEALVGIFITVITDKDKVFSNGTNKLQINKQEVMVNKRKYQSFIDHFKTKYRPSEKRQFTAISDRLIQDVQRRNKGEYYTPSAFVNYATDQFSKVLGENWRNDFVVWDPAWGTGNLTRDTNFARLFASTINQSDLDQGEEYNRGADKFIFDFLNDDRDFEEENLFGYKTEHLSQKLADIMTQQPKTKILFFLNPPYGTAGNANSRTAKTKKGISDSVMKDEMKQQHLKVQEQLYAQFLYRIIKMKSKLNLENVYIGLYSPSLFMTGSKYDKFRDLFLSNFQFVEGNLFKASYFNDVKSNWAIDFSIWKGIPEKDRTYYGDFEHKIIDLDSVGNVEVVGKKDLWNTDGKDVKSLQDYLNENTDEKSNLTREVVQFKSRYKTSDKTVEIPQNAVAYLVNDTNNIEASVKGVYLMSSPITRHIKTSIITDNTFAKQMLVFAARKTAKITWYNQKDEFLAPNEKDSGFEDLLRKSVIYSIFSPANDVISYRQSFEDMGCYHLNPWNFMSNDEIKDLADNLENDEVYNDALSNSDQSFVYRYLSEVQLDDDDAELLDRAKRIVRDSFKFRKIMAEDYPEYALNTWDASWNQIELVADEYIPELLDSFKTLFSKYEDKLSKLIIKNGILK